MRSSRTPEPACETASVTDVPTSPDEPSEAETGDLAGADPAMLDLGSLLDQAQQLMEAQAAAAGQVHVGSSGAGAVSVSVTGGFDFRSVAIDPSVIDPADPELLEDLVLAAIHDAVASVERASRDALGGFDGLLGG